VGPAALVRTWLWGWMAIVQLVLDLLLAGFYIALGVTLVVGVASIPALLVGVPITILALLTAMVVAVFERARVRAFTGVHVPAPHPPRPDQPAWRRFLLDGRPWKASAHALVIAVWGLFAGTVMTVLVCLALALALLPLYRPALPNAELSLFGAGSTPASWWWALLGLFALLVLPLVARGLVWVDVALARALLGAGRNEQVQALSQRVETLTQTRVETVDSVEVERRRIERDLHDGPQQRLVAIAMDLGMARERMERDPESARELLDKAHSASKEAITEMRQVARGIHPPVLTDRGLDAALSALAARSPVPVSITVDLPRRPSPTVEAIAYFCVSEALTNVAKHARAHTARVDVRRQDGDLVVRVGDDGQGGAHLTGGTGLIGLRQRVAAVDGTLTIDSPPGGPTLITVTLPERTPATAPAPAPAATQVAPPAATPVAPPAAPPASQRTLDGAPTDRSPS
jgi:signal transduction histidine kinase